MIINFIKIYVIGILFCFVLGYLCIFYICCVRVVLVVIGEIWNI